MSKRYAESAKLVDSKKEYEINEALELIEKIDAEGYDWLKEEYNLEDEANEVRAAGIIGTCAVKNTLGDKNE